MSTVDLERLLAMERLLATVRTLEVTGDLTIAGARALRIILKESVDE